MHDVDTTCTNWLCELNWKVAVLCVISWMVMGNADFWCFITLNFSKHYYFKPFKLTSHLLENFLLTSDYCWKGKLFGLGVCVCVCVSMYVYLHGKVVSLIWIYLLHTEIMVLFANEMKSHFSTWALFISCLPQYGSDLLDPIITAFSVGCVDFISKSASLILPRIVMISRW